MSLLGENAAGGYKASFIVIAFNAYWLMIRDLALFGIGPRSWVNVTVRFVGVLPITRGERLSALVFVTL